MPAISMRRLSTLFIIAVMLLPCGARAQIPNEELIDLLRNLTPEERSELLHEYGLAPEDQEEPSETDVSAPQTVMPRGQEESAVEAATRRGPDYIAPPAGTAQEMLERGAEQGDGAQATPPDSLAAVAVEIREAFRGFLVESLPLEVDRDLKQFGYELFAGAPTTFAPATDVPVSADYIIGPGDEIRIQLYGKTSRTANLVVERDGMVSFPELGPISVAGLTFQEMKETVVREVENRMIGVSVSVSMGQLRSIRIFVLGDVFSPGSYTVSGLSTMTNALIASGGVKKIGSLRRVQLKRGGELVSEMDLYDLLVRGDTSDDVRLMPGDVIFVPTVGPLAGVAGEVLRPAIYELNGAMSVRELLELAGGLTATAYRDLIQLERVEGGVRLTYDLSFDEAAEWDLKNGDLVKVYPIAAGDELAVFLEGNVLRPGRREYFSGMRLLDIVRSTEELLPETFFDYGLIERESEVNREPEYLSFNLESALLDSVEEANVPLKPRDRVYVFHRAHFREAPLVSVRGEVRDPGSYEYKKDMRILDLVLASGGLTRDAWLDEAELFRTEPRTMVVERLSINLGEALRADPAHNLLLRDMDELAVHSVWEFRENDFVQVLGEVNNPGRYPLARDMRVSDLIFAGGNLRETAYPHEAELTRYEVIGGERRELKHVVIDLWDALSGEGEDNLKLMPYDRLLVRRIKNWRSDEVVRVTGEVAFPGNYPIEEGERLSDLIERFGGFLEDAYLPAAVFRRTDIRRLQAQQLERMADQMESDLARLSVSSPRGATASELTQRQAALESGAQLAEELRRTEPTGRMVIRLGTAEELRGTEQDILLTDGDALHVPKKPDFVTVMGQVNNPTAFQFARHKRASHFVKLAGGITKFGDRGKTHVVKADGSVQMGTSARIDPGDVIIVPETLSRFDGVQFMLDVSQILYQLGLAAAAAQTVGVLN